MFWAVLAGIGACANAGYYIANKKFLETLDPAILAATGFLCSSAILLGFSCSSGIPHLGPLFFPAVFASAFLNFIATILTFRALASTDISLAIPMISFTPIFLVGTAALLLHEFPSASGIAGIAVIVAGSYILNATGEQTKLADPFRAMAAHPGVLAMLAVSFIYAVAIIFDKTAMQNSDPVFGAGLTYLLIGIAFLPAAIFRVGIPGVMQSPVPESTPAQTHPARPVSWRNVAGAGLIVGCLIVVEAVSINTAYTTQIAPYVIAIKRMSILLIVLYGAFVFHEKETVRRLAGSLLMVSGAALILFFP